MRFGTRRPLWAFRPVDFQRTRFKHLYPVRIHHQGKGKLIRRWTALEDVDHEVRTRMIQPRRRVVIVVIGVVYRNSHFRRISVIHVVSASVVRISVEVLRIVYVRIVIESIPVLRIVRTGPSSILPRLSRGIFNIDEKNRCGGND